MSQPTDSEVTRAHEERMGSGLPPSHPRTKPKVASSVTYTYSEDDIKTILLEALGVPASRATVSVDIVMTSNDPMDRSPPSPHFRGISVTVKE